MLEHRIKENTIAICLIIISIISIMGALYWMKPVLLPFTLALLIYFALLTPIEWMQTKLRFPAWLALSVGFLLLNLFIALFVYIVGISIRSLIATSDIYVTNFLNIIDSIAAVATKVEQPPLLALSVKKGRPFQHI